MIWYGMGNFQMSIFYVKVLACPYPLDMCQPILRAFRWDTVWSFIARDITNTRIQTFGFPTLLNKTGIFCKF